LLHVETYRLSFAAGAMMEMYVMEESTHVYY